MAGNIESIEIFPGENGAHRIVHNFKREAGKKSGSMGGGVYMERPQTRRAILRRERGREGPASRWQGPRTQGQPKLNAGNDAGPGY